LQNEGLGLNGGKMERLGGWKMKRWAPGREQQDRHCFASTWAAQESKEIAYGLEMGKWLKPCACDLPTNAQMLVGWVTTAVFAADW
jgi:hypothetical protein